MIQSRVKRKERRGKKRRGKLREYVCHSVEDNKWQVRVDLRLLHRLFFLLIFLFFFLRVFYE